MFDLNFCKPQFATSAWVSQVDECIYVMRIKSTKELCFLEIFFFTFSSTLALGE